MICKECGAEFDEALPSCPYCGALNYIGAEKEYQDSLDELKENLSQMGDDTKEAYHGELKKNRLVLITTFCLLLLGIGIVIGVSLFLSNRSDEKYAAEERSRILWRKQYEPVMDAMYEDGDLDGLLVFVEDHSSDTGYSAYTWRHMDFLKVYEYYSTFQNDLTELDFSDPADIRWFLYDAVMIHYYNREGNYDYSDEEKEQLTLWCQEVLDTVYQNIGMTPEEFETFYGEIASDDSLHIPDFRNITKYLKEHNYPIQ